jgi:hypothetical protein
MTRQSPKRPSPRTQPAPAAVEQPQVPEEEGISFDEMIAELQDQLGAMSVEMTKQQIVIKKQRRVIADLRSGLVAKNRTGADADSPEAGAAAG